MEQASDLGVYLPAGGADAAHVPGVRVEPVVDVLQQCEHHFLRKNKKRGSFEEGKYASSSSFLGKKKILFVLPLRPMGCFRSGSRTLRHCKKQE